MKVSLFSDLHIGHNREIMWRTRGYQCPEDHDTDMLLWLRKAQEESGLCISLGDIVYRAKSDARKKVVEILDADNVGLILGNHDAKFINSTKGLNDSSLGDMLLLRCETEEVVISHYPMLDWPGQYRGVYHLHGHCHGRLPESTYQPKRMDISAECLLEVFGRPVASLDEILEHIDARDSDIDLSVKA